jgi:hypothetical protein
MSIKKEQELIVITKTYDLILWSCKHTSKFPRNHRFVLGERIERNLYGLLEILIQAKYTKNRQRLLEQANLTLEILEEEPEHEILTTKSTKDTKNAKKQKRLTSVNDTANAVS